MDATEDDDWLEGPPAPRSESRPGPAGPLELPDIYEGITDDDPQRTQKRQARQRKAIFLQAFAARGVIADGCDVAGVSRHLLKHWRKTDPWFVERYAEAEEHAADVLEAEAHRRAVVGVDEPVTFQGMPTFVRDPETGEERMFTIKKYSDPLLTTLLKARRPDRFRENVKQQITHEGSVGVLVVPGQLAGDEWERAAAEQQAQFVGPGDKP